MENLSNNPKDYTFQKNAFVEAFHPLTYYEIATGKQLASQIPNSKYVFRSNTQSMTTILRFDQLNKALLDPIFKKMSEDAKSASGIENFSEYSANLIKNTLVMARILWELAIKPKNPISRFLMWRKYIKACLDDSHWFFSLIETFRDFNLRFFFTIKYLRNYSLFQQAKWKAMVYSNFAEDSETRIKRRGLLHLRGTKLIKQAASASMN